MSEIIQTLSKVKNYNSQKMSEIELLPCPFCGGKAEVRATRRLVFNGKYMGKEHYAGMAEHPPDRKASTDFHRPAYPNYTVEDALKKWGVDTKKGVDAGGAEH